MVAYCPDKTGRFHQRPHYRPEELDRECEKIIGNFLKELHGEARYPVDTDDLTKLIEHHAEDLDLYADLSSYGEDVEGVTVFRKGRKPSVQISEKLTNDERRHNRLRTTLTHEYGHVHFHAYLWELEPPALDLLRHQPNRDKVICKRDSILNAAQTDWMEWQAGYACGALLMPKSEVLRLCRDYAEAQGLYGPVSLHTGHAVILLNRVVETFRVSEDAARVRLLKLDLLTEAPPTESLFG
jgi:Zn-dependent peptidase ImmA (M78 family)